MYKLEPAILYESEIKTKMESLWYDEHYKYYFATRSRYPLDISNGTHYAVVNENDILTGHISFRIREENNSADGLAIISFEKTTSIYFIKAVMEVVDIIFTKFNCNKLSFGVVAGNPAERGYDKLIKRVGGKVVGIMREDVRVYGIEDMCDHKMYDILRSEYLEYINSHDSKKNKEPIKRDDFTNQTKFIIGILNELVESYRIDKVPPQMYYVYMMDSLEFDAYTVTSYDIMKCCDFMAHGTRCCITSSYRDYGTDFLLHKIDRIENIFGDIVYHHEYWDNNEMSTKVQKGE